MIDKLFDSPKTPPETEQCCQDVGHSSYSMNNYYPKYRVPKMREKGLDPKKCSKRSQYVIDGKHYCALHAGRIALTKLIDLEGGQ